MTQQNDDWADFEDSKLPVVQSHAVANPLDADPEMFGQALARRKTNREALMGWIREALVEGTDFGKIHVVGKDKCKEGRHCKNQYHFSKPSLFKSGAEKIAGMLGLTPTFPNMREYEKMALDGKRIETIILRCEILDGKSNVVGVGMGARLVSKDDGDLNKAIKMCQKSAQIDATLRTGGLSEIFTQDAEDMALGNGEAMTAMPFGKHSGTAFTELPDDYLAWLILNMDEKPDIKAAAEAEIARRGEAYQGKKIEAPAGYEGWKADMAAKADEGKDALKAAWQASAKEIREYVAGYDAAWWAETKAKALRAAA